MSYSQYSEITLNFGNIIKDRGRVAKLDSKYISKTKTDNKQAEIIIAHVTRATNYHLGDTNFKYLDSALHIASKLRRYDLIAYCHLVRAENYNYVNNKKMALKFLLNAYETSKKTSDLCVKHIVQLKIGVVKRDLGFYDDAILHFNECLSYLALSKGLQYNEKEKLNHTYEYLDALFQCSITYRYKGEYKKADSLTNIGLYLTEDIATYNVNRIYFLQNKGIFLVRNKLFNQALPILKTTLPVLYNLNKSKTAALSEFYLGKCYSSLGKSDSAIIKFKIVDSLINLKKISDPELRENYFYLINHFNQHRDIRNELYFTNKLLRYDSILRKDSNYLTSSIQKEYDENYLIQSKKKLEQEKERKDQMLIGVVTICISLILVTIRFIYIQKQIQKKYYLLVDALENPTLKDKFLCSSNDRSSLPKTKSTKEDLITKLTHFEQNHLYLQKNLSIKNLAILLNTNSTYLSQIINETKNSNYNKYLATLRIKYITTMLYKEPKYLQYTIEALADQAGFNSRQSFSDLFYEINGLRPKDFIKNRKSDLNKKCP